MVLALGVPLPVAVVVNNFLYSKLSLLETINDRNVGKKIKFNYCNFILTKLSFFVHYKKMRSKFTGKAVFSVASNQF